MKYHGLFASMMLALMCSRVSATTTIDLKNPGMEGTYRSLGDTGNVTGQIAEDWSDNSSWADIAVSYSSDPSAHGGVSAQRIVVGSLKSGALQFVQSTRVAKGRKYAIHAWLRGDVGSKVTLVLRQTAAPSTYYIAIDVTLGAEWQEFHAITANIPTEDAQALLMIRAGSTVAFSVDDIRLEDVTPELVTTDAAAVAIQNPGFEGEYRLLGETGKVTGQIAEGWSDNSAWADVAVNYASDSTNTHSGAASQRVAVTAVRNGLVQFVQTVRLTKGHAYAFDVWLRGNVGTMVSLGLRLREPPYTEYGSATAALSPEWKAFRVTGTATEDAQSMLMIRTTTPATFWVDDVRVEDLTMAQNAATQSAEPAPELQNAGLEAPYIALAESDKVKGEIASGWSDNSSWADIAVAYAADWANPHRGETSQRIDVSAVRNGNVHFVQTTQLKQDRVYAFSVWLRSSAGAMVTLAIRKPGAPYTEYAGATAALSAEWQKYRVFGKVTEDTSAMLMIRVSAPMTIWVDDAELEDLTQTQTQAAPREGNLLTGGSFEAGPSYGWSLRTIGPMRNRFADPRPRIDTETAAVGGASLRCDLPRGDNSHLRSPVFAFTGNRPQTVSVWLKSRTPNYDVKIELEKTGIEQHVKVGTEWARYTVSGTPPFLPYTRLNLTFQSDEHSDGATLWVDGAQVEEGSTATTNYLPPFPHEMTLSLRRPGGIIFDGEQGEIEARIMPAPPEGAKLRVSVTNIFGMHHDLPDVVLPVATLTLPDFPERPRGVFKLRGEVVDQDGKPLSAPVEVVWSRLPRPREVDPRKSFFGLHFSLSPDYIALARAAGIRRVRLHDASMISKWAIEEPNQGQWEFHDDAVTAAHNAGLAVLGMFDGAPGWASTQPREGGYWGVWHIPDKPDALAMWENYVRTVSEHYKGRIDEWEVWNEPWGRWFLDAGGKPELYGELVRSAYRVLKEVNPDSLLIAIDTYRGRDFWTTNALAGVGSTEHFDGFSFHDYNDAIYGGPESLPQTQAQQFNDYQMPYGTPKPLWDTEGGAGDLGSFYAPETGGMPANLQPTFIVRHDVTYMGAGIQACYLYAAHSDPAMGELSFQTAEWDRAVKPVLAARAVLANLVDGVGRPVRSEPEKGLDLYTFPSDRGQIVRVVWSYDGATHTFPLPDGAMALDVFGNPMPVASKTLQVGTEPIYLLEQALPVDGL